MSESSPIPLLKVTGIGKSYPGVRALDEVNFDLAAGEVHALVGENGAGKSTLVSIIAGINQPDQGRMQLTGQAYAPPVRRQGEAQGVRMVMQELNLIPTLTVAENIFIENLPARCGFIQRRRLHQQTERFLHEIGFEELSPNRLVGELSVGRQQLVEIARGLCGDLRVLILDEPTASLTEHETAALFERLRRLKAQGVGIIYISHHMEEIRRIADRVTVLRDGRYVATHRTADVTTEAVINEMVGRELAEHRSTITAQPGPVALSVRDLTRGDKVRRVSFDLHQGEILGFAGLMGSGRTETVRCLFGADQPDNGTIELPQRGGPVRIRHPHQAVRAGIALLTEDRKEQGLLLPLSVRANIVLTNLPGVSRWGWLKPAAEKTAAQRFRRQLTIRSSSIEQRVGDLSGGNQQKVVLAKWLYRDCDILICDEPTRGIDVGAKFEIYELMEALARDGKAVIFVSSDLTELMRVCTRMAVMSAGKLAATFKRSEFDEERIMAAAFSELVGSENNTVTSGA